MKTKPLAFLLALTFLFLFSGSSFVFGDDFQDGWDADQRKDYKEAVRLYGLAAEHGHAKAQEMARNWKPKK
jgi:TPR repeat protein